MDLLVTEDGEALLERELEPVAARDPVPRPVVEVLVRNNPLNCLEVRVRRCGPTNDVHQRDERSKLKPSLPRLSALMTAVKSQITCSRPTISS